MDANIKHGMTWMCSVLNKSYDKLHLRVQEDMEVAEKKRQVENAARKERVRKAREERYGTFSEILNTFLFLFSNKMFAIRAGIQEMIVRIANREDPDQTASEEAV